jgi:enoyl-CoA hydratase/carnithine racemase
LSEAESLSSLLPDEVITRTSLQYVDLPEGRVAILRMDNGEDQRRPNTFGPASLVELGAALDAVAAVDGLSGACLTGKPGAFCVGADLTMFKGATDRTTQYDTLLEVGRLGHRVFAKLAALGVPTFGFINGPAMGGGLEVALHCTYRTVSTDAKAIALPEVFLGLIPGWGGTALLPHIAGPDNAVTVIVENPLTGNRVLQPQDAVDLGVADVLIAADDFETSSLLWVGDVLAGRHRVTRPTTSSADWSKAMARAATIVTTQTADAPPAPHKALELLAAAEDAPTDVAFDAEDRALADLTFTPELDASLYAFDLVQKRARRPARLPSPQPGPKPVKLDAVALVGEGAAADALNQLLAKRGITSHPVSEAAGDSLVVAASDWRSVQEVATGTQGPERIVGLHVVPGTPLVEIVRTKVVADSALASAAGLVKQLGRSAVIVDDTPGFVVNRLLACIVSEALRAVDDGTSLDVVDASLQSIGVSTSPLAVQERLKLQDFPTVAPSGEPPSDPSSYRVQQRILDGLAREAAAMLDDGIVEAAADIDICMLLGAGWPMWLGGLTPYLDRTGIAEQVNGRPFGALAGR